MYKILLLLLSLNSFAYFDLTSLLTYRSYPSSGGEVAIESGKNIVIWRKEGADKKSPLFGLIRPKLKLSTSAVINTYDVSLEVYPISFIGLDFGYRHTNSNYSDFDFYDCESINCTGDMKRSYFGQKMALGYKNFIAMGQAYIFRNSYNVQDKTQQVAEFRFFSRANATSDQNYYARYAVGYKFDKDLLVFVSEYNRFAKSKDVYRMNLLTYLKKVDNQIYTIGLGTSKSTFIEEGFSAILQWKYVFKASKKLF